MAKTLVIDAEEKTRVPFLRGILTRSLQDAGISFEQAYQMASEIRQQLANVEIIAASKLREITAEHLRKQSTDKILERYQTQGEPVPTIYVQQDGGNTVPYSSNQLSREFEIVGLSPEQNQVAVAKMFQHLLSRGENLIRGDHLGYLTYRCLHQDPDFDNKIADRYLAWVNFCRSGKPLILLLGGTAGTGKSTVATALASRLEIVRYQSTDMLREVMRMMIPERLMPVLHRSSFNAGDALPVAPCTDKMKENRVISGYRTQAELLSVPCEAVIQRGLKEKVSLLLEGVHVQPSMLKQIPEDNDAVVIHVMLAVLKQKELKKRIKGRSTSVPQRRSERYLANFEAIWHLQTYLLDEADQHDVPIVVNDDKDKVMQEVMGIIVDHLVKNFTSTPKEVFGLHTLSDCK